MKRLNPHGGIATDLRTNFLSLAKAGHLELCMSLQGDMHDLALVSRCPNYLNKARKFLSAGSLSYSAAISLE